MAITITHTPQIYTPSENPIVWMVSTDAPTLVYFKVDMYQAGTSYLVNTFNIYPTPAAPSVAYLELSRILRNLVKWQADNTVISIAQPLTYPVFPYRLVITEMLYASGVFTAGAVYDNSADKFWAWNAYFDRIGFKAYVQNNFVVNSTTAARFLTNKPNYVNVNFNSSEVLYFFKTTQTALTVVLKTYTGSTLVSTSTAAVSSLTTNNIYRLHVSPKQLQAIMEADFTNITSYTIQLIDSGGSARSELRTYLLNDFEPFYQFANIWFANNLGGFDVYQFLNPQKTIATKEVNIKKNTLRIDDSGMYSDNNNGIYNPSLENINVITTTSFKAISRALSDLEANWLTELFQSRQAYLELADGMLAPININAKAYPVMVNKYTRDKPVWLDIDFTLADNLQPTI